MPKRVDVVVIGGGIIGTCTALELSERGLTVALCEKGEIGAEQSSRNWGWVRIARRDPREIPLMIEAIRGWEGLDNRVGRKTGYTRSGILYLAQDERAYARSEAWAQHLVPHGITSRMVSGSELDALMPGHRMSVRGALWTPGDGRAEPQWAAPAVAEGARDLGASILTRCAVRALDIEGGRVAGVFTELGRIACGRVVLAGGAWSRLFAGNAGLWLPQLKVLNTVMRTTPIDGGPEAAIGAGRFAMRRRADGGYTVACPRENTVDIVPDSFRLARDFIPAYLSEWRSLRFRLSGRWREEAAMARRWAPDDTTPFELCRVLDPEPKTRVLERTWAAAQRAFPQLSEASVVQSWAGLVDVTPDAIPVISGVDSIPGLFVGTGFSGHGFGIAPGAARLLADLVADAEPVVDPHHFRLSRFTDGTRTVLDAGF